MLELVIKIAELCERNNMRLVTAESCTGGAVAASLTSISGSSAWFEGGWVVYSNDMKTTVLGVPASVLMQEGAVSKSTAICLAQGALVHSRATHSVAITGIAGPLGGTPEKPVGTVWIAWSRREPEYTWTQHMVFVGDRTQVRAQATMAALTGILRIAQGTMS